MRHFGGGQGALKAKVCFALLCFPWALAASPFLELGKLKVELPGDPAQTGNVGHYQTVVVVCRGEKKINI